VGAMRLLTALQDGNFYASGSTKRIVITLANFSIYMLTYADVCWRMLTYAEVCWRMLKYADAGNNARYLQCQRPHLYSLQGTFTLFKVHHGAWLTYADVCCRMLAYADVCWRMLTYADVRIFTLFMVLSLWFTAAWGACNTLQRALIEP
jgi:hypothetical protein